MAQAVPTITTLAPATATVGQPVSDVATLAGGVSPTGAITFRLFGPDDAVCAGPPVFTSTRAVDSNGQYTSDAFTPTAPGTYRWVAAYEGDAGNAAVTTVCGEANEMTEVAGVADSVSPRRPWCPRLRRATSPAVLGVWATPPAFPGACCPAPVSPGARW